MIWSVITLCSPNHQYFQQHWYVHAYHLWDDCGYIHAIEKYKKWLMPPDPRTNHKNATKKHHINTGSWLLENSMYTDWKQKQNSFMWIHGICEQLSTGAISMILNVPQLVQEKQFFCELSESQMQ